MAQAAVPIIQIVDVDSEFPSNFQESTRLHPMYQQNQADTLSPQFGYFASCRDDPSFCLSHTSASRSFRSYSPSSDGGLSLPDNLDEKPLPDPSMFSEQTDSVADWDFGTAFQDLFSAQPSFEQSLDTIDPQLFESSFSQHSDAVYPTRESYPPFSHLYGASPFSSTSSLPSSQGSHAVFSSGPGGNLNHPSPGSDIDMSATRDRAPVQQHRSAGSVRSGAYSNLRGRLTRFNFGSGPWRAGNSRTTSNLQTLKEGVVLGAESATESPTQPIKRQVTSKATKAASEKRRRTEPKHFCPDCSEGFTTKHNLKNHVNSHRGIKEHVCSKPGCGKAFNTKSDRKRHEKIHENEGASYMATTLTNRLMPF